MGELVCCCECITTIYSLAICNNNTTLNWKPTGLLVSQFITDKHMLDSLSGGLLHYMKNIYFLSCKALILLSVMEIEYSWVVVTLLVVYDYAAAVNLWIKLSRFTVPSLLSFPNMTGDSIVVAPAGGDR